MQKLNTMYSDDSASPLSITKKVSPSAKKSYNFDSFQPRRVETESTPNGSRQSVATPVFKKINQDSEKDLHKDIKDKHKFQMLTYITNKDLSIMQYVFEHFSNGIFDKNTFLLLMVEILSRNGPPVDTIIKDSIEVYDFIDIDHKGLITFSDFSSFFLAQESDSENLSHANIHFKPADVEDTIIHPNYISKILYSHNLDLMGMMEENQRSIKIYHAESLDLKEEIFTPSRCVVNNICFIAPHSCIALLASDKKIYFYRLGGSVAELVVSFEPPESQIHMEYSHATKEVYSYSLSAKIYAWSIDKILSKNFLKVASEKDGFAFALNPITPLWAQKNISCLVTMDSLWLLATGSSDAYIRLYDLKNMKDAPRVLSGHHKGIKNLVFSPEYQYLVSSSYDYDIIIWNPIVGQPLTKLAGHEAYILGISMPPGTNYIISIDAKGCTKIWDAVTLLLIEDKYPEMANVRTVAFAPKYRRIIYAGWKMVVYEYARLLDNKLTEDFPIVQALVSLKNSEIYVATIQSVSVWSLDDGVQLRSFGSIMKSEITAIALDNDQRRLYVADQGGRLKLFDVLTGNLIKDLVSHSKEISSLLYCTDDRMLVSTAWDKTIRTHLETNILSKTDVRNGVLKNLYNAHDTDILCADYSQRSGLLATGSKGAQIRVWNFQSSRLESELSMVDSDIKCIKFLDPFPLLAGSDIEGNISIWATDPHPQSYRCLISWKNMFNLQKFSAITAIAFQVFSDTTESTEESMLYVGDKMGYIRVFSIESLLRHSEVSRIPPSFKEKRRVSNKIEDLDYQGRVTDEERLAFQKKLGGDSSGKSGNVKQVLQWKAHNDAVNQITVLNSLQPILLMTVSHDKLVKFWNLKGENVSNLYQGKTINESWQIKVMEGQRDNTMIKFWKQFKGDLDRKYDTQRATIRQLITEFTDTYEYEDLARIKNDDIFKNFTELEKTVATTLGKTSNNNSGMTRPKAKKR